MAHFCPEPGCGRPKGRGRPKKGWVRVEAEFSDGHEPRWYCSWACVSAVAAREELGFGRYTI